MQRTQSESGRIHPRLLAAFVFILMAGLLAFISIAATPPNGSLAPGGATLNWAGAPAVGSVPEEAACVDGVNCDTYTVTLSGTVADWAGRTARITISWPEATDDFDVFVHKGSNSGALVGSSANGLGEPEVVELDPAVSGVGTGVFTVHVVYFLVAPTDSYSGKVESIGGGGGTPTPTPTATPTPGVAGAPRYFNYYTDPGVADDAGEPSNGVNWNTENVVGRGVYKNTNRLTGTQNTIFNGGTSTYFGGFLPFMLRFTFDDCSSPAGALIEQKTLVLAAAPRAAGDPILFTDHITGRTLVAQEVALTPAGSTTDITDDDGETFQPSEGGAPSGVDHQTIASGPFHTINGVEPPHPLHPHAVYYASQSVAAATSATSFDGGVTYPQQTPTLIALDCTGLHGHMKIAEDGTAFIPDKACAPLGVPLLLDGSPAVILSEDNGLTWEARLVPGVNSDAGLDDPAVGVSICPPAINPITGLAIPCDKAARSNTIYLGFMYTGGRPGVAISNNKGLTWPRVVDIGALSGIKHIAFPEMVVGDPDRAAFAFFGTLTQGNYSAPEFPGIWHLYVATTFDAGVTWTVTNATPNDPIQRGGICGDGTCRNLLDFFDAQTDKEGRIMLAGQDGCIAGCVNGGSNSFTAKAFITRQAGGKRLFAAFDPTEPSVPGAPRLSGGVDGANTKVTLTWPAPDDSGATITGYRVYRSVTQGGPYGALTPIATVTERTYIDTTFNPALDKYYIVTAVNAQGESPFCNEFHPDTGVVVTTRCVLPGLLTSNDVNPDGSNNDTGQNTPADGSVNARQLFVAEPFIGGGVEQLFFTLQLAPSGLGTLPPNSQWFIIWNRQAPVNPADPDFDRVYVAMRTNATGAITFEYGKFGIPINTAPPPPPSPNANTPVRIGDADAGSSYDPVAGVIKIVVSNSKLRGVDGGATRYQAGSDLAATNVRTYFNRPDPGQRSQNNASDITGDGTYTLGGNASCGALPQLVRAFSPKTHGAQGSFDVRFAPLPAGALGVEPRRGTGASGTTHNVVLAFTAPITFTSVTATPGTGGTATVDSTTTNGNEVIVTLTASNAQTVTLNVLGASAGGPATTISVPVGLLRGDTNGDRTVNSADITETRRQSGQLAIQENYRTDLSVDGVVNSADITVVRRASGTAIPAEGATEPQ